jgi:hypothetical protein
VGGTLCPAGARPVVDSQTETAEGLAEWMALSEALTRGLLHALNNRITALGAFAELSAIGDEEFTPQRVLPGEMARLQQVNGLFRLLLTEETGPEPLELRPVLDDVLALHAHHPRLRSLRTELVGADGLMPIRVPRWALLRLLLAFVETAKLGAEERAGDLTVIQVEGDERSLALRASTGTSGSRYALAMAELCGATITTVGDETTIVLPTLLELRRRERAAREGAAE